MSQTAKAAPAPFDPFAWGALSAVAPITEAQREIWLATQMAPEASAAYNEASELILRGPLDVALYRRCWQTLVDRHEVLRAAFSADGNWLCVRAAQTVELPLIDLAGQSAAEQTQALDALRREETRRSFDLLRGPLFSVRLVRVAPDVHHLLLTAHHIIIDGWSAAQLRIELAALYDAGREGREAALPPPDSFVAYAREDAAWQLSDEAEATRRYWLDRLAPLPAPLELPSDRPRGQQRSYAGHRVDHRLDAALVARIRKAGAAQGASLVATMLAGFAALMQRLSGAEDFVIGLSAAAQSFLDRKTLVGHAVHLLPLRFTPVPAEGFDALLRQTRGAVLDAYEHQRLTFGTLLPYLNVRRDPARPPLVPVIFNIDVRNDPIRPRGFEVEQRTLTREYENFDLYMNVVDEGRELVLECAYNAELYEAETIAQRLQAYESLLRGACDAATQPLAALPLMDASARRRITEAWNATARDYDLSRPLHALIADQVARTPDAVAVHWASGRWSYRELAARSDALAAWLRAQGVGPDRIVAVCAQRSPEMVCALLATLKAGGAYLPLDPDYPAERLAFMLEDAQPAALLHFGVADLPQRLDVRCPSLDLAQPLPAPTVEVPPREAGPGDLAYVIYTSGSTGKPKGVLLEHRGIVNRLLWMQAEYGLTADDRVLQKTPYSFDVSVWEFFWPLLAGATLVVAEPELHKDPAALAALIQRERITTMHFVPSMLTAFLDEAASAGCTRLRQVFCSGEALPFALTQRFFARLPDCALHNLYGPTEASVDVSYWQCQPDDPRGRVPIGRPVANTQLYVLDARGEPLPVGVPGELYLGGVQLARGYLQRPQLNAERFIRHPQFGRLYRTGDRCRWLSDGSVEYLGRLDFQVKLRGLRIELGEIEAALLAHPSVSEAVCGVVEAAPGDARLVAWLRAGTREPEALRAHLRQTLPAHMIPSRFAYVDALPRTASGKLDRKALPDPFAGGDNDRLHTPPRTDAERALAAIWRELLGASVQPGAEDRFVDLGGHSLLAVRVAARVQQQFGLRLPLRPVLMDTLAALAARLPGADAAPLPTPPSPAPRGDETPLYFGDSAALFGVYHAPQGSKKSTAVLLCPSWGAEYMRSYEGLRACAQSIAAAGYPALRFDYRSTGDSSGMSGAARAEDWLADIVSAAAELRRRSGTGGVLLLGLRLGALLATHAAGKVDGLRGLWLWDAPASGSHFVEELRALSDRVDHEKNRYRTAATKIPPRSAEELLGQPWPAALNAAVRALALQLPASVPTLLLEGRDSAPPLPGLARIELPDAAHWRAEHWLYTPWRPRESIQRIVTELRERLP